MSQACARSNAPDSAKSIDIKLPRLADLGFDAKASLISPRVVSGMVRLIEFFVIAILGSDIALIYVRNADLLANWNYFFAMFATALIAVAIFQVLGLYRIQAFTNYMRNLPRLLFGWTITFALLIAAVFFFKVGPELSRGWLIIWYVLGALILLATRFTTAIVTRNWARQGRLNRRAVIYGSGKECEKLLNALERQPENDIRIVGIFDDRCGHRTSGEICGYPVLGTSEKLVDFVRCNRLDLLIISIPVVAETRVVQLLKRLWILPVDIRLAAHSAKLRFRSRAYSFIGSVPMIDLYDKPIADWDTVTKWTFDKIVGTLALIALSPVMALVAIAIKLDSKGPVLFRQKRYGYNNELVEVLKFRSMYTSMSDINAAKLVTKDDPRVTPVGRFIRKTSLDELPQLFNVLMGNLSLVGPRPHALQAKAADKLYNDVVDGYFARHKVKPGITGWAQINGWRGETDTSEKIEKRVEHDLYYIENWSVFLDIYILFKTPMSLLTTQNAY